MRVLLTTDTVGGVWTFTSELSEGLLAAGHEISLLSLGRLPNPEQRQWTHDASKRFPGQFRFTASDAPLEWTEENDRCREETAAALGRCLAGFDAEVLHGNQFVVGQYECGVPALITAHSDVLSWAEVCHPEGLAPSPWLDTVLRITRQGLGGADTRVAPTQWMADTLTRLYGAHFTPAVIPNGRDLSVPDTPRTLQAVSVGRLWDPAKGLDLVATIDSPMPIVVAGATSHAALSAPSLPAHIRVGGVLAQPDLHRLFASSSLYLVTSRYEPFGLAPVEAALCGNAILARDIPSLREVWGDGALFFADAPALERLLRFLADHPRALAEAQDRSLAQARRYTRAAMTQDYVWAYEELLMRSAFESCDFAPSEDAQEQARAV